MCKSTETQTERRVIWRCLDCNDVEVSYSSVKNMNLCECGKSGGDVELTYANFSGSIRIISDKTRINGKWQQTKFPKAEPLYFLRHIPTSQTGHLIKGPYTPTGKPINIMIMTSEGKKYFAPVQEFESMSSPVTENQRYIHQLTRK